MDAVLPVDKPGGVTSRRVAATVAGIAGTRKAGHAGTLDPLATGVLLVCLGRATLLSSYVGGGVKHYRVRALFGVETDTYDIDGEVVSRMDAFQVTPQSVRAAAEGLTGLTVQVPPPYSAVRRDGRRLYEYARRGQQPPDVRRQVFVDSIEFMGLETVQEGVEVLLDVICGPGTYIRSLVHDMGLSIGCGACVAALERTRSGIFEIGSCATIEDLERDGAGRYAVSIEDATSDMPTVSLSRDDALAASMGKPLPAGNDGPGRTTEIFRVMDPEGRLVALYGPPREDDEEWIAARAVRVLRPHSSGENDEAA